MKKTTVLMIVCGIGMLAVSCNNVNGGGSGTGADSTKYAHSSKEKANDVIEYTNSVVDLMNKDMDYLDDLMKYLTETEKAFKTPNDQFAFMRLMEPTATPSFHFNQKAKHENPADALSKTDQDYFKSHMVAYKKAWHQVDTFRIQLKDYLKAEDFKDDKGAKGYATIDSVRANAEIMYNEKTALMQRVNTVAGAAEAVILKDSPLREYILNMKADMQSVKEFVTLLEDNGDHYKNIADKSQAAYTALEKAQDTHSKTDLTAAEKASKKNEYESFYREFHDFLLNTKKIMRDAADKGSLTQYQAEDLDRYYDYLIKDYNNFNS